MKLISQILSKTAKRTQIVIGGNPFFFCVVGLAVVQGLWFAFTFRPILFDELRHLQFIYLYSDMTSPFITLQTTDMDVIGQVAREPSYLYYFGMSLLLRLFELITSDYMVQIILLRIVNICLFVLSMFLFRKLLKEQNVSSVVINASLLGFVLLPVVGPMIGAVTYDIGVLPFIFLVLIYTFRIIKQKKIALQSIALLVVIACFASVIKFTSLPIVAACFIIIAIHVSRLYWRESVIIIAIHVSRLYWRESARLVGDIRDQYKTVPWRNRILIGAALVVSLGVFIERPLQNVVKYKDPAPNCLVTLPEKEASERCIKNYVYKRDADFLAVKPEGFTPVDPVKYLLSTWTPGMTYTTTQQYPDAPPLKVMTIFYYAAILGGFACILIALRELLRTRMNQVIIVVCVVYAASVFYSNYKGYVQLGQPVAITARYLLPILPLCIYLLISSLQILAHRKARKYLVLLVVPYLLVSTQGGGIVTHLLSAENEYYWQNSTVIDVNEKTKAVLGKVTKK
jgi:hypothetical protein